MIGSQSESIVHESLTRQISHLRAGELSASELVHATLDQIDRLNPALNALVTVCGERAAREAVEAEAAFRSGRQPRPLEGAPFTVKDLIATAGVRTTAGSLLLQDYVPAWSAPAVARLQAAGAILVGKSNCAEFGMGNLHTSNRLFGDTRNPWDLGRTPGGSSGGDSAGVAAGMTSFGIGTDYGGSVRWPAHCTGVASLRPTPGLVPTTGVLPHSGLTDDDVPNSASFQSWTQTIGAIARSTSDLELLLEIMIGPDGRDSHAVAATALVPRTAAIETLRCAWFDDDGTVPIRQDLRQAVRAAADALRGRGLRVSELRPPGFELAAAAFDRIRHAEGLPDHRALVGEHTAALTTTVRDALAAAPSQVAHDEYRHLSGEADLIRARILEFMVNWPILLLPVATMPAFVPEQREHSAPRATMVRSSIENCCRATTLLRAPVAVVPCGTSVEGLPIGVQVVGRPFHDRDVLAVAGVLEAEFGQWRPGARRGSGGAHVFTS